MEEVTETPKKKAGWPKGKPRKAKEVIPLPMPDVEPPIHVRVVRRGMEPFEFGCAQHFIENGFHIFTYPSKRDPYRQTRREIAISEIVDIEITQAAPVYQPQMPAVWTPAVAPVPSGPPVIHNAKENALRAMKERVEAKMDAIPGITFGDSLA